MQKSKTALFLMELIIVILFFALTSAVCMQVFVKAHTIGQKTEGTNYAVLWADNAAECFFAYDGDEEAVRGCLEASYGLEGYSYSLDFKDDDSFIYMTFNFFNDSTGEKIYSYTFKKHIQEVSVS